jgi:Flp pilus assembly protein TadD
LIQRLRRFPFASGVAGLEGAWEGRAASALENYFAGRSQNPRADAHRTLARAYAANEKHAAAVAQYQAAVRAEPRNALLRFELAMELEADSRTDDAMEQFREASKLDPEDARPHAAMGAMLLKANRFGEGIAELRLASRMDPHDAGYHSALGHALASLVGGRGAAEQAYKAALRADSRSSVAFGGLIGLEGLPETLQRDLELLTAEVKQNPLSTEVRVRLALALAQSGDMESARRELRRSLELDPKNTVARLATIQIHYLAGEHSAALAALDAARAGGIAVPDEIAQAVKRSAARQ